MAAGVTRFTAVLQFPFPTCAFWCDHSLRRHEHLERSETCGSAETHIVINRRTTRYCRIASAKYIRCVYAKDGVNQRTREMQTSIAKWGNSLALRLPSHIARESRLEEGATVTIEVSASGSLVVTPTRKRLKLADLLQDYPARGESHEFDWGQAKGEEAW